jgi:methylated-DNA-protein-cysteine methyltransferase related protein
MRRTLRRGRHETGASDRTALIVARIRAIPEGFVRTYGDIFPAAPRLVGHVLATTGEDLPWHRVVRSDGSVAVGRRQLALLRREGVPIRGGRVDLREVRLPD